MRVFKNNPCALLVGALLAQAAALRPAGNPVDDFPSQIFLFDDGNAAFCLGAAIAKTFVVTPASCCSSRSLNFRIGASAGQSFKVDKAIPHPSYNPSTGENDICLLRLEQSLSDGVRLAVVGNEHPVWFRNPFALPQGVTVSVESHPCYQREIRRAGAGVICATAKGDDPETDCKDNGGPLFKGNTLLGIAWKKSGMCEQFGPYTSVPYHSGWIHATSKKHAAPTNQEVKPAPVPEVVVTLANRKESQPLSSAPEAGIKANVASPPKSLNVGVKARPEITTTTEHDPESLATTEVRLDNPTTTEVDLEGPTPTEASNENPTATTEVVAEHTPKTDPIAIPAENPVAVDVQTLPEDPAVVRKPRLTDQPSAKSENLSVLSMAGIGVGIILLIITAVAGLVLCTCKNTNKRPNSGLLVTAC